MALLDRLDASVDNLSRRFASLVKDDPASGTRWGRTIGDTGGNGGRWADLVLPQGDQAGRWGATVQQGLGERLLGPGVGGSGWGLPDVGKYYHQFTTATAARQAAEAKKLAVTGTTTAASGVAETGTGAAGSYGSHEQYRASIQKWAQVNGIDPDALAAILQIETNGDPRATSPAGARGLGQIMPATWAGLADPGDDPYDPDASIKNAAKYYAGLYRQFGRYDLAAAAYQGGPGAIVNGAPRNDISDGNLTPQGYAQRWAQNYQAIKATAPKAPAGAAGGMAAIWGGGNASITQPFGETEYSASHSDTYDYGGDYGVHGHTGEDVGVARGTRLYAPRGGVVVTAGGTPYFRDEDYGDQGTAGKGELRIQLDNGDILILGHTSAITVRVGQRVNPGDFVGLSGSANGAHVHVEVRVRDAALPSGFRIVKPSDYFSAAPAGTPSQNY